MIAIKSDNYMVRTAQQRDPPTATSAHADHVCPHPAHLSQLLRITRHLARLRLNQ